MRTLAAFGLGAWTYLDPRGATAALTGVANAVLGIYTAWLPTMAAAASGGLTR